MKITEELVAHVAKLSHIQLDDAQMARMLREMENMVGDMDALRAVDTEGVAPMTHIFPTVNVMRADVVTASLDRAALLANAPAHTEEAFVVPRTVG